MVQFASETEKTTAMRRVASAIAQRNFESMTSKRPMDFYTMRRIMQNFYVDTDVIHSWNVVIEKGKKIGQLILPDKMLEKFLSDCCEQYNKKMNEEIDPLSNVFSMGISQDDGLSINLRFPDCLISNFKLKGTYGCIYGLPRLGKTSLACYFMEIFNRVFHMNVITNIPIYQKPNWVYLEKKLSGVIRQMILLKNWICILDETAVFVPKKRAMSETNIDFENLCRFVGKLDGRLILITHDYDRDVPSIIQGFISERYEKIELTKMRVNLNRIGGHVKMFETIRDIPDAALKFKTEDITSIDFDISVFQLLQDMQDTKTEKDMLSALEKQLRKPEEHNDLREQAEEIKDLISAGTTQTEAFVIIGNKYHKSPSTVKSQFFMYR